jgi:hypothetical protein
MKDLSRPIERRKLPRCTIDLPLSFQMNERQGIYAGLIIDASEAGLQIQALKDMSIGLELSVEVFFAAGFELSALGGMAQVIWKDEYDYDDDVGKKHTGYKYGLKFVQISEENCLRLRHLLWNINGGDISPQENHYHTPFDWSVPGKPRPSGRGAYE